MNSLAEQIRRDMESPVKPMPTSVMGKWEMVDAYVTVARWLQDEHPGVDQVAIDLFMLTRSNAYTRLTRDYGMTREELEALVEG